MAYLETLRLLVPHQERTPRAARTRLASPVERGLVREIGCSPQDPKRRYFKATQE